ncbi:SET domain-containing protein-lysine N-methyltransferase [Pseudomonas sp. C2B4]|uniref:SET domain-containing protein-lysine N-methyltransferase n=1 Tax=Pseudomonas sp. C2B4 TaxID=2735270 RepID=UPI0015867B02|nr:SET domain-containing protein-lysine N-methyltransferase [Pseudomonas sp. C2B4]NUU37012.1 lysine methyltransferase [Pseudomonas sp. C2B4]
MKANASHHSPARPPEGVYPFTELPLQLGFPSLADFKIITNNTGKPVAAMALREFPRMSRVCRVSGHLLPYRGQHTRQLAPGVHVYDPRFCGLLQHSCNPNVYLELIDLWLWALQDIQTGDSLTMDYTVSEDKLLRQFACRCGAHNCRGWITGYDEQPNADGQRFLQHWRRL